MKKRLLSLLLALVMVLGLCSTAFAAEGVSNFKQVNTYTDGQFTDVPKGQWYAPTVQRAYELGLMKGTGNGTTFTPSGNITIAETLALACRLHSTYYGNGDQFVQGSPWYKVYVDYAIANGIIAAGDYASYTAKATRVDFVTILAASMPANALPAINTVEDGAVPDIPSDAAYYNDAYRLYRAGILTGSDDLGTFRPSSNIMRSEVATIVVRMADASQRKTITLKKPAPQAEKMYTSAALDLYVGQTSQLSYYFTPSNAEKQSVTWSSSDPAVATVSETGLVTAVGIGTATINIRSEKGLWTSCKVTVTEIGTLANPIPADAGIPVSYQTSSYYAERKFIITCENVITGSVANALATSENRFNETPSSSQEWRFYEFNVTYLSSSDGDSDEIEITDLIYDSKFFRTNGASFPVHEMATLGKTYSAYGVHDIILYPGSSSKVVIGILTDKNAGDALLQVKNNGGKGVTWISCDAYSTSLNNNSTGPNYSDGQQLSKALDGTNPCTVNHQNFSFYPNRQFSIQCTNVITGASANSIVQSENRFNTAPSSSQEWRIYEFNVTYISSANGSGDVVKITDLIYDSKFFRTSGASFPVYEMATLGSRYKAYGVHEISLYPGGSSKVVIGLLVDKDAGDAMLRVLCDSGESVQWILCGGGSGSGSSGGSSSGSGSSTGNTQNYGAELEKYILTYGRNNSSGSKYISGKFSNGKATVKIVAGGADKDKLMFSMEYVSGSNEITLGFSYNIKEMTAGRVDILAASGINFYRCTAPFDISTYTSDTNLRFDLELDMGAPSNYQEVANSALRLAVSGWGLLLLDTAGYTLDQIGFTSYLP